MFEQKTTSRLGRTSILGATALISALLIGAPVAASAASFAGTASHHAANVRIHESAYSRANALQAARDYLSTMAFSRKGLIEQLRYEGYSMSDSVYAVDHCRANWNTQAKLAAKEYLHTMPFSRKGLIDQLKYDGFTASQAAYGVSKSGL